MSNLSLRGVDAGTLAALKARAQKDEASVNSLVLQLIAQGLGIKRSRPQLIRYDDLDDLSGCWSDEEAASFSAATAPFGEVDQALWK